MLSPFRMRMLVFRQTHTRARCDVTTRRDPALWTRSSRRPRALPPHNISCHATIVRGTSPETGPAGKHRVRTPTRARARPAVRTSRRRRAQLASHTTGAPESPCAALGYFPRPLVIMNSPSRCRYRRLLPSLAFCGSTHFHIPVFTHVMSAHRALHVVRISFSLTRAWRLFCTLFANVVAFNQLNSWNS